MQIQFVSALQSAGTGVPGKLPISLHNALQEAAWRRLGHVVSAPRLILANRPTLDLYYAGSGGLPVSGWGKMAGFSSS
jgi:hypothetical protein